MINGPNLSISRRGAQDSDRQLVALSCSRNSPAYSLHSANLLSQDQHFSVEEALLQLRDQIPNDLRCDHTRHSCVQAARVAVCGIRVGSAEPLAGRRAYRGWGATYRSSWHYDRCDEQFHPYVPPTCTAFSDSLPRKFRMGRAETIERYKDT